MISSLGYQWLFVRLSRRFTIAFLLALGTWLVAVVPPLDRVVLPRLAAWRPGAALAPVWTALGMPAIVVALATLAAVAAGLLFALWTATAVYRLSPPRAAVWSRSLERPPPEAPPAAGALGRYHRIGIILAGGGAKGAYQAGSLAALRTFLADQGALGSVRMIAATSIGAWNACFWLADRIGGPDDLCREWWHRMRLREVVAPTYYIPGTRNYVLSAEPWKHAFRALFVDDPGARDRLIAHLREPDAPGNLRVYLTRTNVERAHLEFSTNRPDMVGIDNASGVRRPLVPGDRWTQAASLEDLERAVFASMDMPPLFEYTRFGDELFEDGGVVENLPIWFGTGVEQCDLLFVLPLNASFAGRVDLRRILIRLQRVITIRQGALERKALRDVYLYNELAALRDRVSRPPAAAGGAASDVPVHSPAALEEAAARPIEDRAAGRVHRPVQIFAIAPDEPLLLDTIEFWRTEAAGRAYRLMEEYTRYELDAFDFTRPPNWIRVALVGAQGEIRYLEDL